MTGTVKVYEIAEDLKMDTDLVLQKIQSLGIPAKNKMSRIDATYVEHIKSSFAKDRQVSYVEVEVAPGVRRLKRVDPPPAPPPPPRPPPARVEAPQRPSAPVEARHEPIVHAEERAPQEPETPRHEEVAPRPSPPEAPSRQPESAETPRAGQTREPVEAPQPEAPSIRTPQVEAPHVETPRVEAPRAETPRVEAPQVESAPAEPIHAEPPRAETRQPVAPSSPEVPAASQPTPEPGASSAVRAGVAAVPADVSTQAPRPSQAPPKPSEKRGIEVWDPVKKTIIAIPSDTRNYSMGGAVGANAVNRGPRGLGPRLKEVVPAPQTRGIRPGPGNRMGNMGPGSRNFGRANTALSMNRTGPSAPTTVDPKRKPVIKIEQQISLQELARRMNLKATEVLMKLLQMGEVGKNINSTLDSTTATLLAGEFGFTVEDVALDTDAIIKKALAPDTIQDSSPRPPVVTVMGHVDHGKTTLLDAILGMRVAEGEAGGITQEVRAYRVNTVKGPVVFFDTPGHAAFTALRSRGAKTTDVAVLVVAADDGVMPTTVEAINHAKAAKVPIVVVINKIDKPDANPTRVLQQLMQYDIVASEFGGDTLVVKVSAKLKQGIDELLETLAFQTEYLGLTANAKKAGVGTVFESKLDKGRGAVARVLVQEGIIRNGDIVLAGTSWGRIRAMFDDRGKALDKAGPSTPVEILGLSEPPNAGDKIYVCVDARKAQEAAEALRQAFKKPIEASPRFDIQKHLDAQASEQITVNVVVKADAQGAVEGLTQALKGLSTAKVKVVVLHAAVGAITESDVQLAVPSRAVIIGFNVRPAGKAAATADDQKVMMRFYNIIYEAVDDIKALMLGQLKPTLVEKALGRAEVRQVFNITKVGTIAGCMVVDGVVRRGARVRLLRDKAMVWEGKIRSVRHIKDEVKEVAQGTECGIGLDNTPDIKSGDVIEVYETEEVAAQL